MHEHKKVKYYLNGTGKDWFYSFALETRLIKLDATTEKEADKEIKRKIEKIIKEK